MMLIVALFYFIYKFEWFEKMSFVLVTSFFIYYLIYIFVPVAGPQFYFPAIGIDNVSKGIFLLSVIISIIIRSTSRTELSARIFFIVWWKARSKWVNVLRRHSPSSHVGISTILMIMAWRGSKKLFACLIPFYMLLCGATVYIQAHYVIDAIVGFFSAFLIVCSRNLDVQKWFAQPMFK